MNSKVKAIRPGQINVHKFLTSVTWNRSICSYDTGLTVYLSGYRGLHAGKLLVAPGKPELVQTHVHNCITGRLNIGTRYVASCINWSEHKTCKQPLIALTEALMDSTDWAKFEKMSQLFLRCLRYVLRCHRYFLTCHSYFVRCHKYF